MGCVDAKFLKVLDCSRAEQVAPNSRHHEHIRATKASSDRLIRAFTPESKIEFLPEDRFPRLGELIGEGRQINVRTSNHRNTRAPGHNYLQQTLENGESIWRPRLCQRTWRCVCAR